MNADFIKAKLKNFAVSSGCTFQEALIPVSMSDAMTRIKTLTVPLLTQFDESLTEWDPDEGRWK